MQFKTALAISLFAAAQAVHASPPPCLLAAVNTQPNPADYKTICGQKAADVQKQIQAVCKGDDMSAALASFADTCKSNGVTVSSVAIASSTSAFASGTETPPTTTGASGTGKGSASATATGSGGSATGSTEGGSIAKVSGSGTAAAAGTAKPSGTGTSGAAGRAVGSVAGLAAGAAGLVYML